MVLGKGTVDLLLERPRQLKPSTITYESAIPIAMKTILALVTKETANSLSALARDFTGPAINSGESSLVKANLNVSAAVARAVAIAPATN